MSDANHELLTSTPSFHNCKSARFLESFQSIKRIAEKGSRRVHREEIHNTSLVLFTIPCWGMIAIATVCRKTRFNDFLFISSEKMNGETDIPFPFISDLLRISCNYTWGTCSLSSSISGMRIPLPTSVKLRSKETTAFLKSLYLNRMTCLDPRTNFLFPR